MGTDDPSGYIRLKNNILAGNLGYYHIDFGFRQSGYGNVIDGGGNIVGTSDKYNFTNSSDWTDQDNNGTFTKYGTATTGTLNLAGAADINGNPNKTHTYAMSAGSIAINNGLTGTNGAVSVPTADQRGGYRSGATDIGAYEYEGQFLDAYTLTYLAGVGGYISGNALQTVPEGANGTMITAIPNTGYEFVDWSDSVLTAERTDTEIYDDLSVTANFEILTYNLSYAAGAHGSLTGTASQTVDYEEDGTAVTAVPSEGYNFINWSDGSVSNPRTDIDVTGDINVTANFGVNTYVLTYTAGAHGSISGSTSQSVGLGESGTAITAIPGAGYHFVNWSDASTTNPRTDTNVTGSISIVANFAANSYTLSYSAGSNGSLTGTTSQNVSYGGNGTAITAVPAAGYHFVNWSDASTANPRTDTNVSGNVTIVANFAINNYTVTYTSDSHGTISGTAVQTVGSGGSTTAVTAVPSTGYIFFRWSDNSTQNPRTDTNITSNTGKKAYFILSAYTLSYTAGEHGTIVGDTSQTVYHGGSSRPVAATPDGGYHFVDWSDASTQNPRTDTGVIENKSLTANFALNTYTLNYVAGPNGTISGEISQIVNYGGTGTAVTAIPNQGFNFVSWSDGSISNPRTDTSANLRVTANFAVDRVSLGYTSGPNGLISGNTYQIINGGGSGTAVTAIPATGYSFVNWSDESTQNPRTDINVLSSLYITANFAINSYTLSYAAGENGSLTGTLSQAVNYGATGSAVTAVPAEGYRFANWSDNSTQNPRTDLNITNNLSVTANFAPTREPETVYINSSIGNDTTGDGTSGNPYKTFYKGYLTANSEDILDLTGTFTWADTDERGDQPTTGYLIDKDITISGHGADETIIQAASVDNTADRRVFTIASNVSVTVQDLTVRYGKVSGSGNDGGGIRNNGTAEIINCEIYSNRSTGDSGGGISNRNTLSITGSSIYNNIAYYMGGGIVNSYYVSPTGYLTITNSTIAYNQQTTAIAYTEGGGIHFRKGSGTITNSTISYNTAVGVAGVGMDDPNGVLTIKNTIIANNIKRNSGYYVDFGFRQSGYGNVVDNGYNIIGNSQFYTWSGVGDWTDVNRDGTFTLNNSTDTGVLDMDSSLSLNENPNKTKTFALLENSIAIDAGDSEENGEVEIPDYDQRNVIREGAVDIGAFEYQEPPSDTLPPEISNISEDQGQTTALITWNTDEESSSQVKYDTNQLYSTITDIYNSDEGVTDHEIEITGLIACTKYYYAVVSRDSYGNTSTSEEETFITDGCPGNASVSSISETAAVPEYGGTLEQTDGGLTIGLSIPIGFAEDPTDFQIKSLGADAVIEALNTPTNYNNVGNSIFDIKALSDPRTTMDEFDSEVTVTMEYENEDIEGLEESSLKIYRNDNGEWYQLNDCVVDTSEQSVTCTTGNFSVFGLFGEIIAYNLTYIAGDNGSILGETEQTVDVGGNGSAVTAVADSGYHFVNWSDESTANPRTDTSVSEDISVTAYFEVNEEEEGDDVGDDDVGDDDVSDDDEQENETTGGSMLLHNSGNGSSFIDIDKHWAKNYIEDLYKKGIIKGYDEEHFGPDNNITRAELTKIVVNMMGYLLPPGPTESSFSDVKLTDWYLPYIETAKMNGLVKGYEDGTFKPDAKITRAEAVKVIVLAKYKWELPNYAHIFTDVLETDWFAPYITYAYMNNIVNGYGDGTFGPNNNITRGEVAKIISLMMK